MKEQLRFGKNFIIVFDEMSIEIIVQAPHVLEIKPFIEKKVDEAETLDDQLFQAEKEFKLKIKMEIKEQLGITESQLADTYSILGEAKKLIDFMSLNSQNFLEKVVPELREKVEERNEDFSD